MKILVLGDMHLPYPDMELLNQAYEFNKKFKAQVVVCVGDLTDQKTWSRFGRDTDDVGNEEEWDMVLRSAKDVEKLFPKMKIILGNHDVRYLKNANVAGIPKQMLKSLKEALPIKGWNWHLEDSPLIIDDVVFLHGDEDSGQVEQKAAILGKCVVQGHTHKGRIVYIVTASRDKYLWGMDVATTAAIKSPAFKYAKKSLKKALVAFGTVTNQIPHLYPKMDAAKLKKGK